MQFPRFDCKSLVSLLRPHLLSLFCRRVRYSTPARRQMRSLPTYLPVVIVAAIVGLALLVPYGLPLLLSSDFEGVQQQGLVDNARTSSPGSDRKSSVQPQSDIRAFSTRDGNESAAPQSSDSDKDENMRVLADAYARECVAAEGSYKQTFVSSCQCAAISLLTAYQQEGSFVLKKSGYLDLLGRVWSLVVQKDKVIDLVFVTERLEDGTTTIKKERLRAEQWEKEYRSFQENWRDQE